VIALLHPCPRSHRPAIGRALFERSAAARDVFDAASHILGPDFLQTVFSGEEETLRDTRIAQPALVTVELALTRHLRSEGYDPSSVAGHSVGELPALATAGVISEADAIHLAARRGELMAEAHTDGAMAAVIGLDEVSLRRALPEAVEIANYNSPNQYVISGAQTDVQAAVDRLKETGARRVIPLNVSGAFHSAHMQPASEALRTVLEAVEFRRPMCRFVSSVTGEEESSPETLRALLANQVASPVHWTKVMATLGPVPALEVGPGTVLQGLARRTPDAPEVGAAGTLEQIDNLVTEHIGETST